MWGFAALFWVSNWIKTRWRKSRVDLQYNIDLSVHDIIIFLGDKHFGVSFRVYKLYTSRLSIMKLRLHDIYSERTDLLTFVIILYNWWPGRWEIVTNWHCFTLHVFYWASLSEYFICFNKIVRIYSLLKNKKVSYLANVLQ